MKWGCRDHWGHWGCWGHWGHLGSWCEGNHLICKVQCRNGYFKKPVEINKGLDSRYGWMNFKKYHADIWYLKVNSLYFLFSFLYVQHQYVIDEWMNLLLLSKNRQDLSTKPDGSITLLVADWHNTIFQD